MALASNPGHTEKQPELEPPHSTWFLQATHVPSPARRSQQWLVKGGKKWLYRRRKKNSEANGEELKHNHGSTFSDTLRAQELCITVCQQKAKKTDGQTLNITENHNTNITDLKSALHSVITIYETVTTKHTESPKLLVSNHQDIIADLCDRSLYE